MAEINADLTAVEDPMSDGGNWLATPPGSWSGFGSVQTDGSNAKPSTVNKECMARYIGSAIGDDQFCEITLTDTLVASNPSVGACVRMASITDFDCYTLFSQWNVGHELYRFTDNGSSVNFTLLGSRDTTYTPTAGDVDRIWVVGTSIFCTVNGNVVIGTQTDATWASGNPGLHVYDGDDVDEARISALRAGDGTGAASGAAIPVFMNYYKRRRAA